MTASGLLRTLGNPRVAPRFIVIAMTIGLALRLAFALGYWIDKPLTHDEREYLALARSLANGQGFQYPPADSPELEQERFGRAPVYPFVLAHLGGTGVREAGASSVPRHVKISQSVIGTALIGVLAMMAWRIAGPAAGVVAAVLTAIDPSFVVISAYALSESLYLLLSWLSVWLLGVAIGRRSSSATPRAVLLVFAAGIIGGLAALTRPGLVAFLGLAALWLAVARPWRIAATFVLAAAVVIAPWTARNIQTYGRFVLIASEGGVTFWTGNHPLARGEGDMAANPAIKQANQKLRLAHPGLSPEELEPIYYSETVRYLVAHPVWWVGLIARKAFYLVVPIGPSYMLHSRLYRLATMLPYLALLPFGVMGARLLVRRRAAAAPLWLLVISGILTSLLFFPQERFRLCVIDPALIVCAAAWTTRHMSREDAKTRG